MIEHSAKNFKIKVTLATRGARYTVATQQKFQRQTAGLNKKPQQR